MTKQSFKSYIENRKVVIEINNCKNYNGNQYCNLYKSKVASAYCGDVCDQYKENLDTNVIQIKAEKSNT